METICCNHLMNRQPDKTIQMETYTQTFAGTRLSQSEAMLQALQAGFFEVFFEKNQLMALLANSTCDFIRFTQFPLSENTRTLTAIAIGKGKTAIGSTRNYLTGNGTVTSKRHTSGSFKKSNFFVDFHCGDLLQLLSAVHCIGIRIFPGLLPGRRPTLIAVGVDERGFDIPGGAGYIQGNPG
jgi:hypothetical protein